jgi:hypothetical protein
MSKDLENLPKRMPPEDGTQLSAEGEELFVDYDLLYVDPQDPNKVYGNWQESAIEACSNRVVDKWVDRRQLRDYDYDQDCAQSKDGIWRFALAR